MRMDVIVTHAPAESSALDAQTKKKWHRLMSMVNSRKAKVSLVLIDACGKIKTAVDGEGCFGAAFGYRQPLRHARTLVV